VQTAQCVDTQLSASVVSLRTRDPGTFSNEPLSPFGAQVPVFALEVRAGDVASDLIDHHERPRRTVSRRQDMTSGAIVGLEIGVTVTGLLGTQVGERTHGIDSEEHQTRFWFSI
jgi:hypothetical protein